jgi:hypothetical protein
MHPLWTTYGPLICPRLLCCLSGGTYGPLICPRLGMLSERREELDALTRRAQHMLAGLTGVQEAEPLVQDLERVLASLGDTLCVTTLYAT